MNRNAYHGSASVQRAMTKLGGVLAPVSEPSGACGARDEIGRVRLDQHREAERRP